MSKERPLTDKLSSNDNIHRNGPISAKRGTIALNDTSRSLRKLNLVSRSFDLHFGEVPTSGAPTLAATLARATLGTREVTAGTFLDETVTDVTSVGEEVAVVVVELIAT